MRISIVTAVMSATLIGCSAGPQGPTGPQGPEGPMGPQGPTGPQGPAGTFSGTFVGNAQIAGNLTVSGQITAPLGESQNNPATSCAALLVARPGLPSGGYWLKPSSAADAFQAYCDMTNENGGWTLVWSNHRGGRGKMETEMQWLTAINTLPRIRGAVSRDLESFTVYTGLKHWSTLAPGGMLRYDWSPNYGQAIDQRYVCPFSLNSLANYQITFNVASCVQPVGSVIPGLVASHNNMRFSTYDRDNDTDASNCSNQYSTTPWWYGTCWSGSINGGGELSGAGYYNGAYWVGSPASWGAAGGTGAGNGWIYVK